MSLDIRRTIHDSATRSIPFERIAKSALGGKYELSLVICGDHLAQRMNVRYRNKTYRPNVLSFPIARSEGEIFLNIRCAQRESRRFQVPLKQRLALLFVHGCLHLKGLRHGRIMEREEQRILRLFDLQWHETSTRGSI